MNIPGLHPNNATAYRSDRARPLLIVAVCNAAAGLIVLAGVIKATPAIDTGAVTSAVLWLIGSITFAALVYASGRLAERIVELLEDIARTAERIHRNLPDRDEASPD